MHLRREDWALGSHRESFSERVPRLQWWLFQGALGGEKGGGDQDPEGNCTLWVLLVLLFPYLAHHQRENKLLVSDEVRRRRRGRRRPADRELLSDGALCLPSQLGKEPTGPLLQQNSWV